MRQRPLFASEPAWTPAQLERKARAETGQCVVANCSGPRFQPARAVDAARAPAAASSRDPGGPPASPATTATGCW